MAPTTSMKKSTPPLTRRQFACRTSAIALSTSWLAPQITASNIGQAAVTDPGSRIEKIESFAVRYAMTGHFKFFTGPHGGKGRASVLVKVTTADGLVGWGQSVPIAKWSYETLETVKLVLEGYYAPALLGLPADDLVGAHQRMSKAVADGFSVGMPIARAGLDLALHDLAGKRAGKSVAAMWGRKLGGPLRLSWTLNPRSLEEVDGLIDAGKQLGYRDFNIKVGPDPDYDFELTKRVRELAPDAFLWTDANGGYTPEAAMRAAPMLAEAGVSILEAPMKPNQIEAYQKLTAMKALPILMDEGVVSPVELREFMRLKMLDGVAMKPSRCGGLLSAKAQIEMLERNGLMWVGSGLTDPDVSLAATLQLYGGFGLKTAAALNGPQFITESLLKVPLQVKDGAIAMPSGPGLGVEIDEDKLSDLVARTAAQSGAAAVALRTGSSKARDAEAMAALDLRWHKNHRRSLALTSHGEDLWRFRYDPKQAHCYFHPLSLPGCGPLTWDQPADHVWHHGLWFSWKYINGVNFWENAPGKDRPAGRTHWKAPKLHTFADRSAQVEMQLSYSLSKHTATNQSEGGAAESSKPDTSDPNKDSSELLLTEKRKIKISAPTADGSFTIDWQTRFTAVADEVVLDRTPLPDEPNGKAWGGYAGLSLRLQNWADRSAQNENGPIVFNNQNRYRGRHRALDYQGVLDGEDVGIAIEEVGSNLNSPTPWYSIRSEQMSFITPAVICYGAHRMKSGEHFRLHYRIHVHRGHWSQARLEQL
jgi:L-alanine-DL-glutamate epimerase-like enolase superfamily enzyme